MVEIFERELQLMASAFDNNSLLSNQDINQFLVYVEIELQISYTTIKDFISWANWNSLNGSDLNFKSQPLNIKNE